jgi:hypothetical protein|tara:strand:+ start:6566 stop:6766 length:201 start_codon:yes stop_codon:yes gene_type:complete
MTEKQYNTEKIYTRKDMEKEKRYYLDIIQKLYEQIEVKKKMLTEAEDRADKYEMKYDILFSVKHFS